MKTTPILLLTSLHDRDRGLHRPEILVETAAQLGWSGMALVDTDTVSGIPEFLQAANGRLLHPLAGCRLTLQIPAALQHLSTRTQDHAMVLACSAKAWWQLAQILTAQQAWITQCCGMAGVDPETQVQPLSWAQAAALGPDLHWIIGGGGSLLRDLFIARSENGIQVCTQQIAQALGRAPVDMLLPCGSDEHSNSLRDVLLAHRSWSVSFPFLPALEAGCVKDTDGEVLRLGDSAAWILTQQGIPTDTSSDRLPGTLQAFSVTSELAAGYTGRASTLRPGTSDSLPVCAGQSRLTPAGLDPDNREASGRLLTLVRKAARQQGLHEDQATTARIERECRDLVEQGWAPMLAGLADIVGNLATAPGVVCIDSVQLHGSCVAWLLGLAAANPLETGLAWQGIPPLFREGGGAELDLSLPAGVLTQFLAGVCALVGPENLACLPQEVSVSGQDFESWWEWARPRFPALCQQEVAQVRQLVRQRLRCWQRPDLKRADRRPLCLALGCDPWRQSWPTIAMQWEGLPEIGCLRLEPEDLRCCGYLQLRLSCPLERDLWHCGTVRSGKPGLLGQLVRHLTGAGQRTVGQQIWQQLGRSVEECRLLSPRSAVLARPLLWQLVRLWKPEDARQLGLLLGVMLRMTLHPERLTAWLQLILAGKPALEDSVQHLAPNLKLAIRDCTRESHGVLVTQQQLLSLLEGLWSRDRAAQLDEIRRWLAGEDLPPPADRRTEHEGHDPTLSELAQVLLRIGVLPDERELVHAGAMTIGLLDSRRADPVRFHARLFSECPAYDPLHVINVCLLELHAGRVVAPDVCQDGEEPCLQGNTLHPGLQAVREVGPAAAQAIVQARQALQRLGRPGFESMIDLCSSTPARVVDRGVLMNLILSGACQGFGRELSCLLEELEDALRERRTEGDPVQQPLLFPIGPVTRSDEEWSLYWRRFLADSGLAQEPAAPGVMPRWPAEIPPRVASDLEAHLLGFWIRHRPEDVYGDVLKGLRNRLGSVVSRRSPLAVAWGVLTMPVDLSSEGLIRRALVNDSDHPDSPGPWVATLWSREARLLCGDASGAFLRTLCHAMARRHPAAEGMLVAGRLQPAEHPGWPDWLHLDGLQPLAQVYEEARQFYSVVIRVNPDSVDWSGLARVLKVFKGWRGQDGASHQALILPEVDARHPGFRQWKQYHGSRVLPCDLLCQLLSCVAGVEEALLH